MAYCILRGGMVNIGVPLFCWVGLYLLFNQSSWLMVIDVLESSCVCT